MMIRLNPFGHKEFRGIFTATPNDEVPGLKQECPLA